MTRAAQVAALRAAGSVFPEDEWAAFAAAAADSRALDDMVQRRMTGEPVQQIVGWAQFAGRRLVVAPGVFVPRWRTEFLAGLAARLTPPGGRFLDLACGCGAVAAVVAARVARVTVVATDADPAAVHCARRNLPGARVVEGRDLEGLGRGEWFDVIAANLPYVPTGELHLQPHEARDHEPRPALDGGTDGLDPLRRIAPGLPAHLTRGGRFLVEASPTQAPRAAGLLTGAGLRDVRVLSDRQRAVAVITGVA